MTPTLLRLKQHMSKITKLDVLTKLQGAVEKLDGLSIINRTNWWLLNQIGNELDKLPEEPTPDFIICQFRGVFQLQSQLEQDGDPYYLLETESTGTEPTDPVLHRTVTVTKDSLDAYWVALKLNDFVLLRHTGNKVFKVTGTKTSVKGMCDLYLEYYAEPDDLLYDYTGMSGLM